MSEKCPKCDSGELDFGEVGDGVEYEYWDCNECKAQFYVPIEIVRDFANMEDQEQPSEKCDGCGKSLKNECYENQEQGFCEPCLVQEARLQDDWRPED